MKLATTDRSLSEVHSSIDPHKQRSPWRKMAAFFGPAYLVSVGYMDPGNWATDLAGGSQFGYRLLWVLLMSNIMALLLQSLSARLGIVQGKDLAQCNREVYPRKVNFVLYAMAEIAIAACDLAEVLGMAIGLNLLLGIPLIWGVLITFADTILLLYLQKLGMRKMEAFIIALVAIIGGCFLLEMFFAKPDFGEIAKGFVPSIPNNTALYIAIGIIGATVMPHNLYLHSALVQTRKINRDDASIKHAIKLNTVDSAVALNMALFVNAAILILAAAVFYTAGKQDVASLKDAHLLLAPMVGNTWASHLFAIALIAAGQSSTVTGTLAGQIVMEGYLRLRLNPWARRLITRMLAIVPAVLVILIMGEEMVDSMLVFSQVLLSMQLAFAVIPLIHFVSDSKRMGKFAIGPVTKTFAWLIAAVIVALNLKLVYESAVDWISLTDSILLQGLIVLGGIGLVALLLITTFYPFRLQKREASIDVHKQISMETLRTTVSEPFKRIALALDYSDKDERVIQYAIQLGDSNTQFVLIHVVESAQARMMEDEARDYETIKDSEHLQKYVNFFTERGYNAEGLLGFKHRVKEIARIIQEKDADLLIVGSHGHKKVSDWIFGETINSVRHMIKVPVFIAR
ncbi:Nramp family divalent metal transporter [Polluticoccus soli]|uniref:Nramp family divalent metal transporter n=2 Tax=Chitinophagaceae TaxID=563835 RepID=UPI0023E1195A|nr:Nramp family divalent metal transporter [Flavipsychrobacter sp. JY13-12]